MHESRGWNYGAVGVLGFSCALFTLGMVWSAIYMHSPSVAYRDPMAWSQVAQFAGDLEWRDVLPGESPTELILFLVCAGILTALALGVATGRRRIVLLLLETLLSAPFGILGLLSAVFLALSPFTGGLSGEAATEGWLQTAAFGVLFAFSGCWLIAMLLDENRRETLIASGR